MLIYIIPIVVIILSVLVILFIFVKRLPDLKMLDTQTLGEAREAKTKHKIISDRLNRKAVDVGKKIKNISKPLAGKMTHAFKNFHNKILELDEEMRRAKIKEDTHSIYDEIEKLENKGRAFAQQDRFEDAEGCFIEIIKLDEKNTSAYESLSDLYIAMKDFQKAKETLEYFIKIEKGRNGLKQNQASTLVKMGEVYQALGDHKKAVSNFKKATEIEPKNPKYLDLLVEISIIVKDVNLAKEGLQRLKVVDPKNKKLKDLGKKIASLVK